MKRFSVENRQGSVLNRLSSLEQRRQEDYFNQIQLPHSLRADIAATDVKLAVQHIKSGEYVLKYARNPFSRKVGSRAACPAKYPSHSGGGALVSTHSRHLQSPHQRLLIVNMEQTRWRLQWESPKKRRTKSAIYFSDVVKIVPGVSSSYFAVSAPVPILQRRSHRPIFFKGQNKKLADRELGIEVIATTMKLRIRCTVQKSWKMWMRGLLYTHQKTMNREENVRSIASASIG